jgi:hypothetical protein
VLGILVYIEHLSKLFNGLGHRRIQTKPAVSGRVMPAARMARRRGGGGPGAVFAKARDQAAGLFQIRPFRVPGMKHQRHFESANVIPLREVAQTGAFIAELDQRAQLLDQDIVAYPVLAATLTERRDNLRVTIAALKKRLVSLQGRADIVPA